MIPEASWRGHEQIDALHQLVCLRTPVSTPHYDPVGLRVVLHELFCNSKYL